MKRWLSILGILAILVAPGLILPRFGTDAVTASVAVTPEVLFHIGAFEVTNTLFTSWLAILLLLVLVYFATRKMELVPRGAQNVLEMAVELWVNLGTSVAGERSKKFFPIVTTIFLFVLVSNWLGLIPGFGPVGYIQVDSKHPAPQGILTIDLPQWLDEFLGAKSGEHAGVLAPFVRSPSTDINMPLALALVSVILTQIFGMQAVGYLRYWTKFFNFAKFGEFFAQLFKGKLKFGLLGFGFIDLFVGILEFVSELVKVISFTFRLFGNIFAGEIVLLIMAFLFFAMPFPFYALELFVGFMQAFVFAILTLVFMTIATTPHGAEEHH